MTLQWVSTGGADHVIDEGLNTSQTQGIVLCHVTIFHNEAHAPQTWTVYFGQSSICIRMHSFLIASNFQILITTPFLLHFTESQISER